MGNRERGEKEEKKAMVKTRQATHDMIRYFTISDLE